MFLPSSQNFQAQVSLGKQLARKTDALPFIIHRYLLATHLAGPVTAAAHDLYPANAATAAPATNRNPLPAELLHGLENVPVG